MAVEIVFETHSLSEDNERGIATGWGHGRLSARGRRLARALDERRRADRIEAVFTSDLARAVQTAEIAFSGSAVPVHADPRLRECNYGALNGAPVERLEGERSKRIEVAFPGGESYEDVVHRVRAFLDDLARSHDGRRVLIIGHSATRWALDHLLLRTPLRDLVEAPFRWQEGWEYRLA